jgi:hypothetical protein
VLLGSRVPVAGSGERPGGTAGGTRPSESRETREQAVAGAVQPPPATSLDTLPNQSGDAGRTASAMDALLRAHALPGSPPEPAEDQPAAPAMPAGASGTRPAQMNWEHAEATSAVADQQAALAAATRAAQEHLRTLVDSLGAASRSMFQPPAPPSR